MIKGLTIALLTATVSLGAATGADAKAHRRPEAHPAMAEGGYVLPPVSFTKFCLDYPGECAGRSARVHMDAERMQALEDVNRQVNGAIAPARNTSRFHFWALNVAQGDCNNYAIQKRHELIQRGWPAGALALSVVRTSWGEGHLVVSVRTDAGDYVLDNLRSSVVEWRRAGYQWVMRQSARNPQYWVALGGGRPAADTAPAADEDMVASAAPAEAPVAAPKAPARAPAAAPAETFGGIHFGRGMTLGMADLPGFAGPAAAPLTLKPGSSALALLAQPTSIGATLWPVSQLALADPAKVEAWALRTTPQA